MSRKFILKYYFIEMFAERVMTLSITIFSIAKKIDTQNDDIQYNGNRYRLCTEMQT
jgi:hypothetical protein